MPYRLSCFQIRYYLETIPEIKCPARLILKLTCRRSVSSALSEKKEGSEYLSRLSLIWRIYTYVIDDCKKVSGIYFFIYLFTIFLFIFIQNYRTHIVISP